MEHFEVIYDLQTGEQTLRKFTKEENDKAEAERLKDDEVILELEQAKTQAAAARAALLAKLGITEEEAKLLLGGN